MKNPEDRAERLRQRMTKVIVDAVMVGERSRRIDLAGVDVDEDLLSDWLTDLLTAQTSLRHLRRSLEDRVEGVVRYCVECETAMTAARDDRSYCSGKCRQRAHRRRSKQGK